MTLVYQSDLEEISEPAIRHYLSSETARKVRRWVVLRGFLFCGVMVAFILRERAAEWIAIAALIGGVVGALINHFTFVPSVSKKIRKHLVRETAGKLPAETRYHFDEGKLVSQLFGVSVSFPLCDLEKVSEDEKWLEISFGRTGLCLIPLKAFESSAAKTEFLAELHCHQCNDQSA